MADVPLTIEAYRYGRFWWARGIGADLFTQGETLDELVENVKEAVAVHFEGRRMAHTVLALRLNRSGSRPRS